jgi:hypothetical protein
VGAAPAPAPAPAMPPDGTVELPPAPGTGGPLGPATSAPQAESASENGIVTQPVRPRVIPVMLALVSVRALVDASISVARRRDP